MFFRAQLVCVGEGEVRDRQLSGLSCVPGSADFDYCESECSERESNWARE